MQKAHLYEAIFLGNQGIDEAVRGLERLKKAPEFAEEIYRNTVAQLEHARAQVNLQFFSDMERAEKRDAARYERRESKGSDSGSRVEP